MRLGAIEDVRDRLALVRRQGGDVDQRLHLVAARRRDHGAGIGVTGQDDRPRHPLQGAIERRHVILERCQRQRRRRPPEPSAASGPMIFAQLDPSAQAPWTSTTLTSFEDIAALLLTG